MVCVDCKEDLPIHAKGLCRKCYTKYWRKQNPEKATKSRAKSYQNHAEDRRKYASRIRIVKGMKPFYENKNCSQYLGIHVAERILSKIFKDVVEMPLNHSGYDFICNKGKKIDVKSCSLGDGRHSFLIRNNTIADFFLCISFKSRNDLTPINMWLFPGNEVNMLSKLTSSKSTISKWDEYKLEIGDVVSCCNEMKK